MRRRVSLTFVLAGRSPDDVIERGGSVDGAARYDRVGLAAEHLQQGGHHGGGE